MTCAACSGRIERQLNKLAGVEAVVNLAAEKAHIRYAPNMIDAAKLIATIEKTGFGATPSTADTHEEEKARKLAAYREELRRFWISLALTLPLIGQMAFMFGGAVGRPRRRAAALAAVRAGHAGAVLDRQALLRRRLECAAQRRRQHGRAGGAGHFGRLFLQRRGDGARHAPACLFRGLGHRHHPGADGQDPRSARQGQDLGRHRGADQAAAADRACRARRRNWSRSTSRP